MLNVTRIRAGVVVATAVLVGCGRQTPQGEPGAVVSFAMDVRGGTIEYGPLTLIIPAGALAAPTTLTIRQETESPWGAVGPAFELAPDGLTFAVPPTLAIAYDELDMPAGVTPENLRLAVVD